MVALAIVTTAVSTVVICNVFDQHTTTAAYAGNAAARIVDIGFSQHMALHHDQAVVMANIVQGRASGRINAFADSISTEQLIEIGEMKGWLKLWGMPLMPPTAAMDWATKNPNAKWNISPAYIDLCRSSPGGMPGLATIQELNDFRNASGDDLDIRFLQLMLRHHQGALPMARYAAVNAETPAVQALAANMVFDQRHEIKAMQLMLQQMGGEPLAFPDFDNSY